MLRIEKETAFKPLLLTWPEILSKGSGHSRLIKAKMHTASLGLSWDLNSLVFHRQEKEGYAFQISRSVMF